MKPRIYLDIDGVLNCSEGAALAKKRHPRAYNLLEKNVLKHKHLAYKLWYPPSVEALKRIVNITEAEIYIHSSWRDHFKLSEFRSFFKFWGFDPKTLAGVVPRYKFSSERWHDISWHIEGCRLSDKNVPKCVNYVVIDDWDMTDIFKDAGIFKNQIVTDYEALGLTEELADKAIEILMEGIK